MHCMSSWAQNILFSSHEIGCYIGLLTRLVFTFQATAKFRQLAQFLTWNITMAIITRFQVLEKITQQVLRKINTEREDMESRSGARNEIERTASPEETMELMSAVTYGYNLMKPSSASSMPSPLPQNAMAGRVGPQGPPQPAKAVSSIKTNIKAATQVHPYQRN